MNNGRTLGTWIVSLTTLMASLPSARASDQPLISSNRNFARSLIVGSDDFLGSNLYANQAVTSSKIKTRAKFLETKLGFDRATALAAAFIDLIKNPNTHERDEPDLTNISRIIEKEDPYGKEPEVKLSNPNAKMLGTGFNKNALPSFNGQTGSSGSGPLAGILGGLGSGSSDDETTDTVGNKKWDFNISPLIFARLQIPTRLLSLNTHFQTGSRIELEKMSEEERTLKIEPQTGAFRVEMKRGLQVGAGVTEKVKNPAASASFFVGLAPLGGRSGLTERTLVGDEKTVRHSKSLSIPDSVEDLNSWNLFDKFTRNTSGGILFVAGASYAGFAAGLSYTIEGSWTSTVQKIGATKVYAKHVNQGAVTLAPYAGTAVLSASYSKITSVDDSFSFAFDLADSRAMTAFTRFIKGDVRPAQELAADTSSDTPVVVKVDEEKSKSVTKMKTLKIGIPSVIGMSLASGKVHMLSTSENHLDNSKTNVAYGVYVQNKMHRFINNKDESTFAFYGADYTIADQKGTEKSGRFGQVGYSYRDNVIHTEGLQNVIQGLVDRTGFSKELWVKVPDVKGNIGYLTIEFQMKIGRRATEFLSALAKNSADLNQIETGITRGIDQFFELSTPEDQRDEKSICWPFKKDQMGASTARKTAKELRDDQLDSCRHFHVMESKSALKHLKQAAAKMEASLSKDRKAFAEAYAEFGKAMMKNRFVFQAVFQSIKDQGVSARYVISGTRVATYDLSFDWGTQIP